MARRKKKKALSIAKTKFYLVYGLILIFIGFFGTKYHSRLYELIPSKQKAVISDIKSAYSNITLSKAESDTQSSTSYEDSDADDLEIPAHDKTAEIIHHKYYTLQYDEKTKQADWVAYELDKAKIQKKSVKRKNDFRPDPLVKRNSATLADYRGSGYDRGHLCPAAAMRFDKTAMSESFYSDLKDPVLWAGTIL